jgi:hypothetical protein
MDAWAGRLRTVGGLVRKRPSVRPALAELAVRQGRAQRCSLNRPVGARRRLAVATVDLARLRVAAHRQGGTVNDALLAAVAGALGGLLDRRGEQVGAVVATVAVSGRRQTEAAQLGNAVGIMPLSLPTVGDASSRLRRVAAISRARKSATPGSSAAVVGVLFRVLAALGVLGWWISHQRFVHTFVTNLRGPDHEVRLAGARVRAIVPMSAISGNVTVAFGALSYAGTLTVTMIADPDRVPDLPVLAAALQAELDELAAGHDDPT